MEIVLPQPGFSGNLQNMEVDMDVDVLSIEDELSHRVNESNLDAAQSRSNGDDSTTPNRVYMCGVDELTTTDITTFAINHYPPSPPIRVEWIDDTSATIVFNDAATASKALESFTIPLDGFDISLLPVLQLRRAKALSTHPASVLHVRTALTTDQKRPRAYETSRFYLMHPEHDPREQRRRRRRSSNGAYHGRRYSDEEHRRRKRRDHEERFDPSMYDDEPTSRKRELMDTSYGEHNDSNGQSSRRRADSYRPTGRDRSASPGRQDSSGYRLRRQRTPPPSYRSLDPNPFPSDNSGKELFPVRSAPDVAFDWNGKGLLSNKILAAGLKRELFPTKVNNSNHHRRSDAFDAADETADLFASGLSVPFSESSRTLADCVTTGSTTTSFGRLKESDPEPRTDGQSHIDDDLSIRGASSDFFIRGSASAAGTIKELFPGKVIGNGGKELFAGKVRGGRRNKAEDMFH